MNRAIELHDSTLHDVVERGADRIVQLRPAYIHESRGVPAIDPGKGYVQDVDIIMGGARVAEMPAGLPCKIWDGALAQDHLETELALTIPLSRTGEVSLHVALVTGQHLRIAAHSVATEVQGESRFVEAFPGKTDV